MTIILLSTTLGGFSILDILSTGTTIQQTETLPLQSEYRLQDGLDLVFHLMEEWLDLMWSLDGYRMDVATLM